MELNLSDLNLDNIGSWPMVVKAVAIGVIFVVIIVVGYWFDSKSQLVTLTSTRAQERSLLRTIEVKQREAVNLAAYREQLRKINVIFNSLLQQLPSKSEVPGLLEDISKTGVTNGLQFKLFKPLPEVQTDFYAELPIQIPVVGKYHQLAKFISAVAGLDRIVTLHDFSIQPVKKTLGKGGVADAGSAQVNLVLNITAKTYRYLGDGDTQTVAGRETKKQ